MDFEWTTQGVDDDDILARRLLARFQGNRVEVLIDESVDAPRFEDAKAEARSWIMDEYLTNRVLHPRVLVCLNFEPRIPQLVVKPCP